MANEFCLKMPNFHITFRDLLHAINLRRETNGFTSLLKEGVLRIYSPWKIRRLRPGLNPRTWVPKGQHATSRPPKLLKWRIVLVAQISQSHTVHEKSIPNLVIIKTSPSPYHMREFKSSGRMWSQSYGTAQGTNFVCCTWTCAKEILEGCEVNCSHSENHCVVCHWLNKNIILHGMLILFYSTKIAHSRFILNKWHYIGHSVWKCT